MSKATKRSKQISTKISESPYPPPFDKAPASIEPFLGQLDPSQVYITHIDRHKIDYKKQIYFLAVLVNSSIVALLAWRFYAAAPKYLALGQRSVGIESSASVDTENTSRREQLWILFKRVGMMLFDFLLIRLVGPWPWSFFFERPANPVTWRWKIGFLPQEVVVRTCRNWKSEDLMQGAKRGDQSPFFKTRIQPAIDAEFMYAY